MEKLNNLLSSCFGEENLAKYTQQFNHMSFTEILELVERDLNSSTQLLVAFQDNSYVIPQIEEIHKNLSELKHKKKKEKELFEKIQLEEKKEQSLFEKARTFNPKTVD